MESRPNSSASRRGSRLLAAAALSLALVAPVPALAAPESSEPSEGTEVLENTAQSVDGADCVVINEAFPNGGSGAAAMTHRYVELHSTCDSTVSLEGWSLQYRARTTTTAPTTTVPLSGEIQPGGHYLIQGGGNAGDGDALPEPDASTNAAIGAAAGGTYVLATTDQALAELPTGSVVDHEEIADLLGFGTTNTFETSAAQAGTNAQSLNRSDGVDTDVNSADFSRATPSPTNSAGETTPGEEPTDPEEPSPEPTEPGEPEPTEPEPTEPEEPEEPTEPEEIEVREISEINQTLDAGAEDFPVTTRGVVTAVYPADQSFNGFYVQTAGSGGDIDVDGHEVSDAIFVYSPWSIRDGLVEIGDFVEVTADATVYFESNQLSLYPGSGQSPHHELAVIEDEPFEAVKPASIEIPENAEDRAALLGMLIDPQGTYTVTDHYTLNQYGEIGIVLGDEPLINPTSAVSPGSEAQALAEQNSQRVIYLDDAASTSWQNWSTTRHLPLPYITIDDPIRVGAEVIWQTDVIMDYRFDEWRLQPLSKLTPDTAEQFQPATFEDTRPGEQTPAERNGDLRIAAFNVLNYFVSLGEDEPGCDYYTDIDGEPTTADWCDVRGAYSQESFERQEAKLVAAIGSMDADVVALQEIENSRHFFDDGSRDHALARLVEELNTAEGSHGAWDYVASPETVPAIEAEDVIRNGFIFRADRVEPEGDSYILFDEGVAELNESHFAEMDLAGIYSNAREPLAQQFQPIDGGAEDSFIAIVNHFKSKGSAPSSGENVDSGDGQGAWNADRIEQSQGLVAFAEALEDHTNIANVYLLGDFNSYEQEDPLAVLSDAGYSNLSAATGDYTYMFDGAVGSLDHLFATESAAQTVTQTQIWNINAVEPIALEYSRYNSVGTLLYSPDQWRASDHDPILADIALTGSGGEEPGEPEHESWDPSTIYTGGETVEHDGGVFTALWWTQNQEPGASSWGAWSEVGTPTECAGGTYPAWAGSTEFTGGETVVYGGTVYTAKWYSRAQVPGEPWGPWEEIGDC